jgi:hypothetical protein
MSDKDDNKHVMQKSADKVDDKFVPQKEEQK